MKELKFELVDMEQIDKKLAALDRWCRFYDWSIYKYGYNYVILDDQTNEIEDTLYNKYGLIKRITSRALDYYCNEWELDNITMEDYRNIVEYFSIYSIYVSTEGDWYKHVKEWLEKLEVKND